MLLGFRMIASESICTVEAKQEADKAPRINLKDLGLDPKLFSPSSADLISKLPDTPSSRALVLDIARAAVKQEPKSS